MGTRMKPIVVSLLTLMLVLACSLPSINPNGPSDEEPADKAAEMPTMAVVPSSLPESPGEPPPEPTEPPVQHVNFPGSSSLDPSTIHDQVTKEYAQQRRAYAGDEFSNGRLERPFSRDMEYLPFLDIVDAMLAREKDFMYFTLALVAAPEEFSGSPAMYGIEMDSDFDGRGDYLLISLTPPTTDWTQDGVQVWMDGDDSVGSVTPVKSDPPAGGGNGYETLVFNAGQEADPDLAWSRLNPDDDSRIDLALKPTLFGDSQVFTWGAFVDGAIRDAGTFDLNDRFSLEDAGSALKESNFYPLKNFFAFDNTCRTASGYESKGGEPGICPVYKPPAAAEEPPPGANCVCTNWILILNPPSCTNWVCN